MSYDTLDFLDGCGTVAKELIHMVIGDRIGRGMSRQVYEFMPDKSLVIKIENRSQRFQNVMEWQLWQEVQGTPYEKWFAPCVDISDNGSVLLQKKTTPVPKNKFPKKVPHFFTDMKHGNFGLLNGKFVCVDYGSTIVSRDFTKKMKKAEWFEDC